jgi:hypothetical protein
MNQLTAHKQEYNRNQGDLYLAFELGNKKWKLGFTIGYGQKPRERTIVARGSFRAPRIQRCPPCRPTLPKRAARRYGYTSITTSVLGLAQQSRTCSG